MCCVERKVKPYFEACTCFLNICFSVNSAVTGLF